MRARLELQNWEKTSSPLVGTQLSGTAMDQWQEIVAQAKVLAPDNSTHEEKIAALRATMESSPQRYQDFGRAHLGGLEKKVASTRVEIQNPELLKVSHYAEEFGQIAQSVAVFSSLVNPKVGPHLDKMAMGSFMLSTAMGKISTSGWTLGPTSLCAASVLMVGQGLFGLLSCDNAGSNDLAKAFNAICSALVQISQQINQLGHYVEERFNRLEKILGGNHRDILHHLRVVLFRTDLNANQLKTLLRGQHQNVLQALTVLQVDVHALFERQQAEIEARLRNTHGMLKELHFIQTQLDRRLVNSVHKLLSRSTDIDEATFIKYSGELCQAITMESHGSDTLTGRDLSLDNMEAIRSRILMPLAQTKTGQEVIDLALHNPELLKNTAIKYQALPGIKEGVLPNFVLFKERLLAFWWWHDAYKCQQSRVKITERPYQDVQEVIEHLTGVNAFIQTIDSRILMTALSDQLNIDYQKLQTQINKAISEFSVVETKALLTKRLMQIQQQEELLAYTQCPVVTASEANNIFDFNLKIKAAYPEEEIPYRFMQYPPTRLSIHPSLSALPLPKQVIGTGRDRLFPYIRTEDFPPAHQTLAWSTFDYKLFIEQFMPLAPKSLQEEPLIDWDTQLCPQAVQMEQRKEHHVAITQTNRVKIKAFKDALGLLHAGNAAINLFDIQGEHFQALNSILLVGPRVFVSEHPEVSLSLIIENSEQFAQWIPKTNLIAELLGLGILKFSYNVGFSERQERTQKFNFTMQIQFIPSIDFFQAPIQLFTRTRSITVSRIYEQLTEVTYNFWYKKLIYNGDVYDFTCNHLTHNKPILKRSTNISPLFFMRIDAVSSSRADELGKELITKYLSTLRKKSNQAIEQLLLQPKHLLAQLVFQLETSAALIKLSSGLLMPQQIDEILAILSRIKYLHLQEYHESLNNGDVSLIAELQISQPLLAEINTQLMAVVNKMLVIGDQELPLLHDKLVQYQEEATVIVPSVGISLNAEASAEIGALRALISEQSTQIAEQSAQIQQLTAMLGALLQQGAQATPPMPSVSSSNFGLFRTKEESSASSRP